MKTLSLQGLLILGATVALTGCPPAYPKCENDEACKEHNEVCVQGQCQECAGDQNCKQGFTCQKNKCAPAPAAPAPKAEAPAATPAETTCAADADCTSKQLCVHNRCVDITDNLSECGFARVHFDFNSVDLRKEELSTLDRMARCLRADHALHVTVEGNADERGTEEYNLQLSQRRAQSVEKYLETLGASAGQLKTVGYGYENPICKEHDEACWAKNRRAGLKPNDAAEPVPPSPKKKK